MEKLKTLIVEKYKNNKKQLYFVLIATFIWGLAAHGYMFLNNSVSHDYLNEMHGNADGKISLGRFMVPIYQFITRGLMTLPWLVGLLGLLYIGLSVFLIVKIFNIKSRITIILTAGICTVNISVISLVGTYLHDFDGNMLGLLLSTVAVFLWKRYKYGFLIGTIPLAMAIGFYQSLICVPLTLVMLCLIIELLNGASFKPVFQSGLKSIITVLLGGVLYYIGMTASTVVFGVELATGGYNTLDLALSSGSDFLSGILSSFVFTVKRLLNPASCYSSIITILLHTALFGITAVTVIIRAVRKKTHLAEALLISVLIILLPLGMNITRILTGGLSHHLMLYALNFSYFLCIILSQEKATDSQKLSRLYAPIRVISCLLVAVILFGNIRVANKLYLMKNFQYDATLAYMSNVVYDIEKHEDYIPGVTEVAFIGTPMTFIKATYYYDEVNQITGFTYWTLGAALSSYYKTYFDTVLMCGINIADNNTFEIIESNNNIKDLSVYPNEGSIKLIDGVLVVKLGE